MTTRRRGGRGDEKATNLKVLPPDTDVHGKGSIMEEFRDALLVDCAYCHKGPNWATEENPRKELARQMILMTRSINTQFAGAQAVTCYSCHRGAIHPASLSNKNYDPSAERK